MYMLFVGIVVSLLITELTGYSPGGIIVIGYLAYFAFKPPWIMGTLAVALVTLLLVRLLEKRVLLYGRRLFAAYILIGLLVGQTAAYLTMGGVTEAVPLLVIGYLIPGLIARDFARQGIGGTIVVLALGVILTRLVVMAGEGWIW